MTDIMGRDPERWDGERKSPAQIEAEIEQTRERMSEDIDAIGEKLSPRHIKQRAREAMHGAQEAVVEKVQEVGRRTREAGTGLVDFVRHNPLPAAMTGVGIYWLYSRRRQFRDERFRTRDFGYGYGRAERWEPSDLSEEAEGPGRIRGAVETAKDKASEVRELAGEKIHEVRERASSKMHDARVRAGERAHRTGDALQRFFEDSPVIAAAGVAVLGAIIGASLPRTRRENELMGSTRDQLFSQAGEVAEHAREAVRDRLSEPAAGTTTPTGYRNRPQGQADGWEPGQSGPSGPLDGGT